MEQGQAVERNRKTPGCEAVWCNFRVQEVHEVLHAEGAVRLISMIKLETRTDKEPTLAGKRLADN